MQGSTSGFSPVWPTDPCLTTYIFQGSLPQFFLLPGGEGGPVTIGIVFDGQARQELVGRRLRKLVTCAEEEWLVDNLGADSICYGRTL